ncbi:MAG: GAF domain-containing protein, partial [Actinomycetota bacterium]|nr:GAF domain-containing protein [Actinomycetota bacterium]
GVGLVVGHPEKPEFVNEAFCALSGYSADEVLALPSFLDIVAPHARGEILRRARRRIAGGDEPSRYETEILHRNGQRIPVEVSAHVAVIDGRAQIVATLRDLTEDKRVAADLAARARQQEAVAELGRLALVDRDLASLMAAAVNGVANILGVEYVEVLELLPDRDAFLVRAGVGWDDGVVGQATVPAGLGSPAGFTLASDAPLVVEDMSAETRFGVPPLLSDHGIVAGLTVVIRGDDQPYGVLGAEASHHREFSRDDVHFLRAVANVLADAIARTGVEAKLATRARQQAAVAELGRRAVAESNLSVLLEAAVNAVLRTLDVHLVGVYELLPDGEAFRLRAGAGWEDGLVGAAIVGSGLDSQAGFALASDAPVVVDDLARETRFTPAPLLLRHGVFSGMSVIILGRGRPWGVLAAHATTRRRFSADDVNFLQATANVVSEAIGRAEMEGALRDAHDRERRLRRRLEAHSRMVVEAQEAERRRIARELHDEIGQTLTGLKLMLEDHQRLSPEDVADRVGRARGLAGELLQRVQDLSLDLRPAVLDDLGLAAALLWLVERYRAQTGVDVALRCCGLEGRRRPELETAAYRIVQEALTNVARHAGVKRATVQCAVAGDALCVEVTDGGIGFDVEGIPIGKSGGLAGMEERARSTGGRLWLRSARGHGTTVVAELPVA